VQGLRLSNPRAPTRNLLVLIDKPFSNAKAKKNEFVALVIAFLLLKQLDFGRCFL
jgi:hypothetical protein